MSIATACSHCQARFSAPESAVGRRVTCSKCKQQFVVQQLRSAASPAKPKPAAPSQAPTARSQAAARSPRSTSPTPVQPTGGNAAAVPAPPPARADAKSRPPLTEAELAAAFTGSMPRSRTPVTYQFGLLASAVVMIALILVYLALIAAACYAVYYHLNNHTGMLQARVGGRGKVMLFIAYLAPAFIGPVIIFFMLKPLLARPAKDQRTRSLTRKSEPLLFAFVDRVCQTVGAPQPKRIDVTCDVNASASFRRGLLSFLGRDLVLTIGLPLMAGLSLREFGGVLAHEFGHFAQGAGMRLTYLVRSISHWFMRVVYERDQWDQWLADTAGDLDLRIGWVVLLAQGGVAVSRGVLWVLMHVGMAVSGLLLRQMEFDADRYETRFGGAESFAATSRKLRLLGLSSQLAQAQLMEQLADQKLVEDLSSLIVVNLRTMPPATAKQVTDQMADEKTGWFDTHPCDRERIAAAERTGGDGIFQSARPARDLLADFAVQSKATTWDQYMGWFGPQVPRDALVAAPAFARACKSSWKPPQA